MKSDRFTAGQLFIERTKHREGPPIVYTVSNGLTSRLFTDNKRMLAFIRWPKGTPTGTAIREWLASFDEKPHAPAPEADKDALINVLFEKEPDPTANTKMVT
tara:strand:- start:1409 stop:1714 length:306 start_codon:yes stop_codon:yes gene_type:complete